jgi:RNA polymerase sigma factor (TIGR02999 family)
MRIEPEDALKALLTGAGESERTPAANVLPLVYEQLRELARAWLAKEPPGATFQPTALVHEAYLRLAGPGDPGWEGRRHFFGAAATAMRRILIERARRAAAPKHGGEVERVDLKDDVPASEAAATDCLALDAALHELERHDPALAELVSLRYFGGLSVDQTAEALRVAPRTVDRDWRCAKAFLLQHMTQARG